MRIPNVALVGLILVLCATGTRAEVNNFMNGNQLYDLCQVRGAACHNYVAGIMDGYATAFSKTKGAYCLPEHATVQQAADVAMKFLEENPNLRHYAAGELVVLSLTIAFSCL